MTSIIGHRGWRARYPDNTLTGFQAATRYAEGVELDVRRSGDGKLVLSHDPTLGDLEVTSNDWATLGELDLGDGHHPALLDEVVAALPDTIIQFEIKNLPHQPGFEPDHRVGLEAAERVRPGDVVTSFFWPTLVAVRRDFPDVATGALIESHGDVRHAIEHSLDAGHGAVVPHESMFNDDTMAAIVDSGLESYAWTVNDSERAKELAEYGVSGIITDDPELMFNTLRSNK